MPRPVLPHAGYVAPMLPTLVAHPPDGDEWVHEIKFDGYRTQLAVQERVVHAYTRNGHDWTAKYGPVVEAGRDLQCRSAILDGELCVQTEKGLTSFKALRRAIAAAPDRLVLFAFDLLEFDGQDLRTSPLRERRRHLKDLLEATSSPRILFSPEHQGQGPAFFRAADSHGLEGIVSKLADSRYIGGRSKAWLKIKSFTIADYGILGIERSAAGHPVALLATLGKDPSYVGDAVVTLKPKERDRFWSRVEKLGTPRARLGGALAKRRASWVSEGLVARVRHLRGEDKLRHATIQSIGPKGEPTDELDAERHPRDE